jgi:5'-methylthioadenosine phosphorylase
MREGSPYMGHGMPPAAVIGGSGVEPPATWAEARTIVVDTPWGRVPVVAGRVGGRRVYFVSRHGPGHRVPPHRVPYRANMWALTRLGVKHVVATSAVGSLRDQWRPGTFVLADQLIDWTKGRAGTFFDGEDGSVVHVDLTAPYCVGLRATLSAAAALRGLPAHDGGTYVATEGPRFETAAEIVAARRLGGDVVGMTGAPEAALAREAGLCYAALCTVTNLAAGLGDGLVEPGEVFSAMTAARQALWKWIDAALPRLGEAPCRCPPPPRPLPGLSR